VNASDDLKSRPLSDPVAEAAGYWDARLRAPDCTDDERGRFAVWRDEREEHREAFERLQSMVASLRQNLGRADVRGLRDSALGAAAYSRRHKSVAVIVAGLAITSVIWLSLRDDAFEFVDSPAGLAGLDAAVGSMIDGLYQTGTGETSAVTLRDGSTVTLNARTRIRIAIGESLRCVELIDGQALFTVAKDPLRPFVVRAADRDITALGTSFDVRLDSTSVRVTLLEGKLKISRDHSRPVAIGSNSQAEPAGERILAPGQQLVALWPTANAAIVRDVDVAKVTGWRDGRIFLEDLTLASAVAEMNRYSAVQISIADPQIAGLRVNGMFRAGEQDAFVTALQDYFPISARRDGDTQIALTRTR
jgi:transmembrane sensor